MKNAKSKMRTWISFILVVFMIIQFKISLSQEFELPGYISDLSTCDFDNNGVLDILITCPYADTLVILFNNGFGGFEIYYYEITALHAICGCVDEDSIPDLIAGVGQHYYYKSYGDRTFDNGLPILTFSGTITIYGLVDLNDDGWNDLLYTNTSDELWGIFKNNGNLTFTDEIVQSGSSTTDPGVGFITDDSLPDIVLTYSAFDRSSVNVNNGNLSFTEVVVEQTFIGEAFVMNIDNQETEDFVFVNYYTNSIPLYKFIGNDQFEQQSNYYVPGTYTIGSFVADDFNQDGYDDFIISRCNWYDCTDSIYIYLNDMNWSFNESQRYYVGNLSFFNLKSADLNGDSFPDLYMSGAGTNGNKTLKILWNDGTGSFSSENPVFIDDNDSFTYQINVFPNPFHGFITIEIPGIKTQQSSVTIYDLYGRLVKKFAKIEAHDGQHLTIDWNGTDEKMDPCPEGIYILTIKSNSNQISKLIIKH